MRALVSAVVAHAGVILVAWALAPVDPPPQVDDASEIALEEEVPIDEKTGSVTGPAAELAMAEPSVLPAPSPVVARHLAKEAPAAAREEARSAPAPAPILTAERGGTDVVPAPAPSVPIRDPGRSTLSPWYAGRPSRSLFDTHLAVPPSPAPGAEPAPRPQSTTGGLREALDAHDQSLGVGASAAAGPVVSAVHAATSSAFIPNEGAATLLVTTDARGHVTSVRVSDVGRDTGAWGEVARAVEASMRGRTLPVPSGAKGVVVAVRVDVAMRLPSGAHAGSGVGFGLADPASGVGLGVGMSFDLADVGAKAKRAIRVFRAGERRVD